MCSCSVQAEVISPALFGVPSVFIAQMAWGSGISWSLNLVTACLSIAEVVAPESSSTSTRYRMSWQFAGDIDPAI